MPYLSFSSRFRPPAKRRRPVQTRQRRISTRVLRSILFLLRDVHLSDGVGPVELQNGGAVARLIEGDGELFGRRGVLRHLHLHADKIAFLVVISAPLARLFVNDERPLFLFGNGVEGVAARGNTGSADGEVDVGLEAGGRVRAGPPDLSVGNQSTEDLATAHRGAAVVDGDGLPVSEGKRRRSWRAKRGLLFLCNRS